MSEDHKPTVEERLDIEELFAKYCWALNTGDAEAYLATFAPDGWIHHDPPGRCAGREAILALLDHIWYRMPHTYLGRQHHPHNFLIRRDPGGGLRVKAYVSITRLDQMFNTYHPLLLGHWEALCTRPAGEWRFQELTVVFWNREGAPWVGDPKARFVPGEES